MPKDHNIYCSCTNLFLCTSQVSLYISSHRYMNKQNLMKKEVYFTVIFKEILEM